jgi:hypothetical protein
MHPRRRWVLPLSSLVASGCSPAPRVPTFAEYPARLQYDGPGVSSDWASDSSARQFRTRLEGGRVAGANFAGHLSIVVWGCGTQCRSYQVLDLRTGRLISDTLLDFSCTEPEFRRDSELIVQHVDTVSRGPCGRGETRYFRWTGEHLVEIGPGTT